ncbi:MAG: hypothetical protein MUP58_00665 [Candidatus Nanohaloarchaeota archaeon QJJ-9]|nr:hypothetical protein [Candidatus Nanohaloarchaeota archaeon QJJ-9]
MGAVENLLKQNPFDYDEELFIEAANEAIANWSDNKNYKARLERSDFEHPSKSIKDFYAAPTIDMREFKENPEKITIGDYYKELVSSGTSTGERSRVPRGKKGLERHRNYFNGIGEAMLPDLDYMAILGPSEEFLEKVQDPNVSNKGTFNYMHWGFGQPYKSEYFLDMSTGEPKPDFGGMAEELQKRDGNLGIFGLPPHLDKFMDYIKQTGLEIDLGKKGAAVTAGGWKGLEGKGNEEFRQRIADTFDIPREAHVDFYGCTESMIPAGNKYGDENPDKKRVPSQGLIYVADEDKLAKTGEIEPKGTGEGLAIILDTLTVDHPGAILTDDIVKKTGGEYGEDVRIEHLGRSSM